MPVCTYLDETDIQRCNDNLDDKDIQELLNEINKIPGQRWCVRKTVHEMNRGWFRRPKEIHLYTIFSHVHGPEWQIIQLASQYEMAFGPTNRNDVLNFLLGFVNGLGVSMQHLTAKAKE